jgi:hypothetical protein
LGLNATGWEDEGGTLTIENRFSIGFVFKKKLSLENNPLPSCAKAGLKQRELSHRRVEVRCGPWSLFGE